MLPPPGRRPPIPQAAHSAPSETTTPPSQPPARRVRTTAVTHKGSGLTPPERRITPQETAAFAELERQAGGRGELVTLLEYADAGKPGQRMVGLLNDPQNDTRTLAQVAAQAGISRAKFYTLLQAAFEARAKFKSGQKVAQHLPVVVEQVMQDAQREVRPCDICDGVGTVPTGDTDDEGRPTTKTCPVCKGIGKVVNKPPTEVRKLALQMGKMIETGQKTTVNTLIANNNQPSGGASFDALMTKLDEALYSQRRAQSRAGTTPVDGEFTEAE